MKKLKNVPIMSFIDIPKSILFVNVADFFSCHFIITSRARNIDETIDTVAPNLGMMAHAITNARRYDCYLLVKCNEMQRNVRIKLMLTDSTLLTD